MSSNPNLQKIGKRKNAAPKQQADWLFPSTEKNASTTAPKSQTHGRSTNKQDKQLAKDLLKRRAEGPSKYGPPAQLMAIVSAFLSENEFDAAAAALQTERHGTGLNGGDAQDIPSLTTIYTEWLTLKSQSSIPDGKIKVEENGKPSKNVKQVKGQKKKTKVQEPGSDVEMADAPSSSSSSSASSSSSSSSSDSDADDEKEIPVKASPVKSKVSTLKRKAASTSSLSSTSGSDSSSEDEVPRPKKVKTTASSPSISSSSSSSEIGTSSSDSADTTSSAEDSTSDSDESSTTSLAQKIPLPDSGSSSSGDSSDSDSSSASSEQPALAKSESSATLNDSAKSSGTSSDSDDSSSSSDAQPKQTKVIKKTEVTVRKLSPPLPPDPVVKKPFKKTNVPFSRIPKDIKVDKRLASNAYVPYDYAQKAHEDLIVTRGKGFTKEKNKKKRGSYRGGYIDVEGKKGIKFED